MTDDDIPISCRPTLALSLAAAMQRTGLNAYAATEQHEALSFRTEVERLGEDPDAWEAYVHGCYLSAMSAGQAREVALATIAAVQRTSSDTLDNFGLRIQAPRAPEPSAELVAKFTRLYGDVVGRRTAAAIVAWPGRKQRAAEFKRSALGQLERASRSAAAHAAVIRAVTGHRAGERPRLRASVRAVLGEARS